MNAFMLMMGGSGTRFGSERPKQYTLIHGRPLFSYITERADRTDAVCRLAVVSHPDWLDYAREWCEKTVKRIPFTVTAGGDTRSASVLNGLRSLEPFLSPEEISSSLPASAEMI